MSDDKGEKVSNTRSAMHARNKQLEYKCQAQEKEVERLKQKVQNLQLQVCSCFQSCLIGKQSNFISLNIIGTLEICSRHGYYQPLRVHYSALLGANGNDLRMPLIFYKIMVR